jgi:hypothetical protein
MKQVELLSGSQNSAAGLQGPERLLVCLPPRQALRM